MTCWKCGKRMKGMPDAQLKCTFLTCIGCGATATYEWDTTPATSPPAQPRPVASRYVRQRAPRRAPQKASSIRHDRLQVLLIALGGFTPPGEAVPRSFIEEHLARLMQASPEEIDLTFKYARSARMLKLASTGFVRRVGGVPMLFSPPPDEASEPEPDGDS